MLDSMQEAWLPLPRRLVRWSNAVLNTIAGTQSTPPAADPILCAIRMCWPACVRA